jgi:hypothetical protein
VFSSSVLSEFSKPDCPISDQKELPSSFQFLSPVDLKQFVLCENYVLRACNMYLNLNYACFMCHVILYLIHVNLMQICIFECLKYNDECFLVNMLSLEKPEVLIL